MRKSRIRSVAFATITLMLAAFLSEAARASDETSAEASTEPSPDQPPTPASTPQAAADHSLGADIRAYFTAPLHWTGADWAWVGGSLLAIGVAHSYDSQVYKHFVKTQGTTTKSNDLQDFIPTVVVLGATWGYANLVDDNDGRREAAAMFEAAGLSGVTAYAIKYATRRERPDQTSDPNEWGKSGGDSFPSEHATISFAVGTVLAESGNDEYRWLRRVLGYGLGVATSYERLKHNTHWFSDVIAGAALGIPSGRFAMHRRERSDELSAWNIEPLPGGAMITYRLTLR